MNSSPMPRRVRVSEVVRVTGLSRATVDRALNNRGGVHPETVRVVQEVYEQLRQGAPARDAGTENEFGTDAIAAVRNPARTVDAVVRYGRGLTEQLVWLRDTNGYPLELFDMAESSDDEIVRFAVDLCRSSDRPLIIGVKNSEHLSDELAKARKRGKRIITMVSDLNPEARDSYVGIDNRKAGQAVALIVGNGQRNRPSKVGVVLGDSAFRCHEDREIGFRSLLRAKFPNIALTDAAKGEDSVEKTRLAVLSLVNEHPDIEAIYNIGGGNIGLAQALKETNLAKKIIVVTHEINSITLPLVRDGTLDFLIAQSPAALLENAMRAALGTDAGGAEQQLIDFTIHTEFNVPALDHSLLSLPPLM